MSNKNRSQTPYSRQENSSLNRSRGRTPYSHQEDSSSNIGEKNHRRNQSRERDREGK